jgi:glycerol-3-phosphate O-acyltransferase/dihydroxyacetone phosphate acyltransferase
MMALAGFAVMALGAAAANPALDIKIVPVGV